MFGFFFFFFLLNSIAKIFKLYTYNKLLIVHKGLDSSAKRKNKIEITVDLEILKLVKVTS